MNQTQSFYQKRRLYIILTIIGIIIFISTPIIIFFLTREPSVSISNLDQINTSITNSDKQRIEKSLLNNLRNLKNFNNANINDVYIRPESYIEKNIDNITEISFLVDIDSQKITYRVDLYITKDTKNSPEDIMITCPTYNETKYPTTPCYGMEGDPDTSVPYFPYNGTTDTGISYTISLKNYNGGDQYLEISTKDCKNLEEAKTAAISWLTSVQAESLYPIEVKRFCD